MILVERKAELDKLSDRFGSVTHGHGHAVFLIGEAGIGKTSLVNAFTDSVSHVALCYRGACDSLFTPRPLGPLYDVSAQVGGAFDETLRNEKDRGRVFSAFLQHISSAPLPVVLVFEDIHWADEATIDFIKFLSRRITRSNCLFLLTFRDNEAHAPHPLSMLFGQLTVDTFSKIHVQVLSREAVDRMALEKGHLSGAKIYELTGGNPFYVTEILASGQHVPERVKDSIITTFHSRDSRSRELWEILSILPSRIDLNIVEELELEYPEGVDEAVRSGVLVNRQDHLAFKHELFRIAIEESLSRYRRRALHRKVLVILLDHPGTSTLAQLVHHAQNADDRERVMHLAPLAGKEASEVGAHVEAASFFQIAINMAGPDSPQLAQLNADYAYECYLINMIETGIAAQLKAVELFDQAGDVRRHGDAMRFLSRLSWFGGDRSKALTCAALAVTTLELLPPARELALAYSNMSQLAMLQDDLVKTIHWGEKAIALAGSLNDPEILSHALNNVGSIVMKTPGRIDEGVRMLEESLSIALKHNFQEHAARAFTNAGCFYILIRDYLRGEDYLGRGIRYCEELDLLSWHHYMLGEKTRLLIDTGRAAEAEPIAISLRQNSERVRLTRIGATTSLARLRIRQGRFQEARELIDECRELAAPTGEAYRIMPLIQAELELCWTADLPVNEAAVNQAIALLPDKTNSWHFAGIAFWMRKCGMTIPDDQHVSYPGPFKQQSKGDWRAAADEWRSLGCVFEQALTLLEGDAAAQRGAIILLEACGATGTSDMIKMRLRELGLRHIPRGPRESTRNNPAQLTTRQVEILSLLREGAQNKQIAERLFISAKTVDHHISAILGKLDVNSRARAVAEAQRLGILK